MNLTWTLAALALAELLVTIALYVRVGRLEAHIERVLRRKPRHRSPPGPRAGRASPAEADHAAEDSPGRRGSSGSSQSQRPRR